MCDKDVMESACLKFKVLPGTVKQYLFKRNAQNMTGSALCEFELDVFLATILEDINGACLEMCESPIEMLLALELGPTFLELFQSRSVVATFDSQKQIGKYRVDFEISYYPDIALPDRNVKRLVVECDGHDFHEKTKKQAQRDKERDRMLQIAGYPVLRFTGSEIYRSPSHCALQVAEFIVSHL